MRWEYPAPHPGQTQSRPATAHFRRAHPIMNSVGASDFTIAQVHPDTREMRDFHKLPLALQARDEMWIPPLMIERRAALSARKNPYFRHAEAAFFLARRDGRPVGRISAQIDRLEQPGIGHFGLLTAEPDACLIGALLGAAETWLRDKGVRHVTGPFNLSINQEAGLLVSGHDSPPMLMTPHDQPHLAQMIERFGYAKERDLLAYLYRTEAEPPDDLGRILDRRLPKNVILRPLRKSQYAAELRVAIEIFNDAWSKNWGFVPLTEAEMDHMAEQMKPLVHERLVWFAELGGEPVGFIACLPNLNEAIADLGGRLFPFGWVKLLWRLKVVKPRSGRVLLMGIRSGPRTSLVGGILITHLMEAIRREALALSIEKLEMSWILEDNLPMRRLAEAAGGRAYKTYRIYGKDL